MDTRAGPRFPADWLSLFTLIAMLRRARQQLHLVVIFAGVINKDLADVRAFRQPVDQILRRAVGSTARCQGEGEYVEDEKGADRQSVDRWSRNMLLFM